MYLPKRFLEFIPASIVWITLIGAISLSFIVPVWVIYFIIIFDLLWFFRVVYFVFYLTTSWYRFKKTEKTDWSKKLQEVNYSRIYHLIFLPTVNESVDVIRRTLNAVLKSAYDPGKFIIVLAGEERAGEQFKVRAQTIMQEYHGKFKKILITVHPKDVVGEIIGKGSNLNYSGRQVKKYIDQEGIPYEKIIVSSFDVDTTVHEQYYSYLTYLYCTHPNPTRSSYQPIALYSNTIWDAEAPVRIAAFGTTFWLLSELARPERLFTFSSHSMSFKMLVDVGFWENDIVSEDSRIFLQGFFHYHGDYEVTPMYLPVSMDAVYGENYWKALIALYKQQRRWAWGVEHFPYMIKRFREDNLIPWQKKVKYLWNHMEGMYTWATAPILIFVLGWLPLMVVSTEPNASVLVQNAPRTLEILMQLAMIGVFASAILSLTMLPHPPEEKRKWHWLGMILQWILLPVTFVVFGAFPAIDAQTRLLLGKYLGFNVTEKK